jgi:PemK-like, MazF-like toxin of type II toxin-antitoxin system
LVLAEAEFGDLILCQITSQLFTSKTAINVTAIDFHKGGLPVDSYIRPDKLFTADHSLVERVAGGLDVRLLAQVLARVRSLFESDHLTANPAPTRISR